MDNSNLKWLCHSKGSRCSPSRPRIVSAESRPSFYRSLFLPTYSLFHVHIGSTALQLHAILQPSNMDQLLKARKLSSASARRKRIQQQEKEEVLAKERYIQHKRRIFYDQILLEDDAHLHSESEDEAMSNSQHECDDSVQTPSECSVTTPQDTPSAQVISQASKSRHAVNATMNITPEFQILVPDTPLDIQESSTIAPPSPEPQMLASLAAPSDWQYDRFSVLLLDSPNLAESLHDITTVPDLEEEEEEEEEEEDSPLETAKPISFRLPKTRPSVISISSRSSSKKRGTESMPSSLAQVSRPSSPLIATRSEKRLSMMSTRSGFQACEAKLVQVPDLPDNAMYMIANASREDLLQYSRSEQGVQRKASAPILSAIKTSHARMSSIKNLIKTPSQVRVPSLVPPSPPESQYSNGRPSTSAVDILNDNYNPFETVPANLNDLPTRSSWRPRPKSSHRLTTSGLSGTSQQSVTALPVLPPPPSDDAASDCSQTPSMRRKKSFSSLRKRSESIGHAIKSAALKSKPFHKHEDSLPPPPLPVLMTPAASKPSVDFPTPPMPSPRSIKSRASYSPFPPSPRLGGPIGLGLKV
jgi:hypothetical protein